MYRIIRILILILFIYIYLLFYINIYIAFMMFWGFSWQRFADILAALHDGICPLAQQGRQQLSAGRSASG